MRTEALADKELRIKRGLVGFGRVVALRLNTLSQRRSDVTCCSPLPLREPFLSTKLPLGRRLLKMIGGLATRPKAICRIPAPCWMRSRDDPAVRADLANSVAQLEETLRGTVR